jgi:D-alanyl-D-alanine carboxypeptidase
MTHPERARTAPRRARSAVLAAAVAVGALLVGVGAARSSSVHDVSGPSVIGTDRAPAGDALEQRRPPLGRPEWRGEDRRVADGQPAFDDRTPAVANLDPALLDALRRAATDAARDGVALRLNSGWRSAEHQAQLLRDAVDEYGSEQEAARWVATPETSAHVSGDAVDIGPSYAAAWLSRHGSAYGLCQIYDNEPWHFELRPDAVDDGCPARYANPTHDPRMQR